MNQRKTASSLSGQILKVFCLLMVMFSLCSPAAVRAEEADFRLTMLDVGQGLSILCETNGEYLLYDGGGRSHSSYVVAYLKKHGIDRLRYMIVSHYDEDHIAGLVGVLNTTEVDMILSPDYEADTKIYDSFRQMAEKGNVEEEHPEAGDSYQFGEADIQILGPMNYDEADENNDSLAVRISTDEFSAVITGDAEFDEEADIVNSGLPLESDLYVVGHHGSSSSSSEELLDAMGASAAFISAGEDNSYGHPTEQTLEALNERGTDIYRTDLQGEVTCTVSDGEISFSEQPAEVSVSDENQAWVENVSDENAVPEDSISDENTSTGRNYVLNTNTKKFHYPDCKSVGQMKEKNRQEYTGTREELIASGYDPCGNCNP
ncbi:MAG: ComEC/Rec2 family competence protein [Eubacteriales bacterium]|nr:ComEC/Rec2 family competence protein [Eubacteriales bacterium]